MNIYFSKVPPKQASIHDRYRAFPHPFAATFLPNAHSQYPADMYPDGIA